MKMKKTFARLMMALTYCVGKSIKSLYILHHFDMVIKIDDNDVADGCNLSSCASIWRKSLTVHISPNSVYLHQLETFMFLRKLQRFQVRHCVCTLHEFLT